MATIVTRAAKGSPLTHVEVDANFTNLNTDKVETSALATVATSGAYADLTGTPTAYTDAAVDTHLNTGTATTGEVLSWTGTDYDWIAAGGGGSALELYAENPVSPTAPSATGNNAVAIGSGATASGGISGTNSSVAIGTSALASSNASAAFGGSNARANGVGSIALGYSPLAGSTFSAAIGYNSVTATGSNATALTNSYASGTDSFAAAIANNTSSYGATGVSCVAHGQQAKATTGYSFAHGFQAKAVAASAIALGQLSEASANDAIALGRNSLAAILSKVAIGAGKFSAQGDAQTGILVLRSDTTDATPEALTSNNSTAGTTNQIILPNSSAYAFHGTIVARQKASDGTASAAWKVEGLIRREANAASTVLVNSALTVLDNTPAWGLALTADTTNGGLKIEVTGAAATNIRWVATINTSEVTYA
jgi:hypothetical protein